MPGNVVASSGIAGGSNPISDEVNSVSDAIRNIREGNLVGAGEALKDSKVNRVGETLSGVNAANVLNDLGNIAKVFNTPGNPGEVVFSTSPDKELDMRGISIGLHNAPDEIEARLTTDVNNPGVEQYLQDSIGTTFTSGGEIGHISMHLQTGSFQISTDTGSPIWGYLSSVVFFAFVNNVQRTINFSIPVGANFTPAGIVNYMNTVALALQRINFMNGVIAYCNNPLNRNAAMVSIRNSFTAEELNLLNNLTFMMTSIPIPPGLRDLVYYISGTFRFSGLSNSSIIKLCPFPMGVDGKIAGFSAGLTESINQIGTLTTLCSVLSKACPSWISGNCPAPNATPIHDSGFTSFFANSASIWGTGPYTTSNAYPISGATLNYQSFTDSLDGIWLALQSWVTGSSTTPGLWQIYTTTLTGGVNTNKFYWNSVSKKFDQTFTLAVIATSCYGHHHHNATKFISNTIAGSQPLLYLDNATVLQSVYQALSFIFSVDTIGKGTTIKSPPKSYNSPSKGSKKGR